MLVVHKAFIILINDIKFYLRPNFIPSNRTLFQAETKVRPEKKDVTTEPSVETTTKAGETDVSNQSPEDSDNTKPSSETLITQEIEESKDNDELAAATAESKPEKVAEQIKRSTRRKGKKEKRQSSGKRADPQSSASDVPDIGKLKITTQEQK